MILIIGGNGSLVNTLLSQMDDHNEIVVAGRTCPTVFSKGDHFYNCDFNLAEDVEKVSNVVKSEHRIDYILFCIASKNSFKEQHINITTLKNTLAYFPEYKIIYFSTIKASSKSYTENTDVDFPLSPYAWSKFYCENILKYEHPNHMIIRLGYVISEHSIKYYEPVLSINLLFTKVAVGISTLVKAISSKPLVEKLLHDLDNYEPGKMVEYWDKKVEIIKINKMLYPKYIWVSIPSSLLRRLIKMLYIKTPFVKFIDYASFGNK